MLAQVLVAIALAAVPQSPASAPSDNGAKPATESLTRIRAKLAQPQRLKISATDRELPEPTFHIEIRQHPYFTQLPFIWTFAGGGYPLTAPGLEQMGGTHLPSFGRSGDVLPLFASLKRAIDEHAARAEVEKAFAEFCATHICVMPQ